MKFGLECKLETLKELESNKDEVRLNLGNNGAYLGIISSSDAEKVYLSPYVVYENLLDSDGTWINRPRIETKTPLPISKGMILAPEKLSKGYIESFVEKTLKSEKNPNLDIYQLMKNSSCEGKFNIVGDTIYGIISQTDNEFIYLMPHLVNENFVNANGEFISYVRKEDEIPLPIRKSQIATSQKVQSGYMDYLVKVFGSPSIDSALENYSSYLKALEEAQKKQEE